jgi:hypothetical protein
MKVEEKNRQKGVKNKVKWMDEWMENERKENFIMLRVF